MGDVGYDVVHSDGQGYTHLPPWPPTSMERGGACFFGELGDRQRWARAGGAKFNQSISASLTAISHPPRKQTLPACKSVLLMCSLPCQDAQTSSNIMLIFSQAWRCIHCPIDSQNTKENCFEGNKIHVRVGSNRRIPQCLLLPDDPCDQEGWIYTHLSRLQES